jgi:hypothetical protein
MPELALDFDVSAFTEGGGKPCELAPDHDAVPFRAALVRARFIFLLVCVAREKEVSELVSSSWCVSGSGPMNPMRST